MFFYQVTHLGSNWNNGLNTGTYYWNLNNSSTNRDRNINSYKEWIKHCNGYNFYNKYIYPLNTYLEDFYYINIYKGGKNEHL